MKLKQVQGVPDYTDCDMEKVDTERKLFELYTDQNHPAVYTDVFIGFAKETECTYVEFSDSQAKLDKFPGVLTFPKQGKKILRILSEPNDCMEGLLRCCLGMAYHRLGYTLRFIESDEAYIGSLLEKPNINALAKAYLLRLYEMGYLRCLTCDNKKEMNVILNKIGLMLS